MKDDTELDTFLPKTSLDSSTTVAANSGRGKTKTKVQFVTVNGEGRVKKADVLFIFDEDFTIEQAAEHAIAHFPDPESAPSFSEFFIFLQEGNGVKRIAITDFNLNLHSMFSDTDTMIVANDRKVFKIEAHREGKCVCITFLVIPVLFCGFIGTTIYFSTRHR
ncbi:CIC11C00000001163 [Sungouiella intermedia]|uniref:CIC11C00000001163 n=1 Tax=Sungouiella intermedia TaxID=45354 RepID=A0A1L0C1A4_9ASCO|nr:CIC11C00000001163 [[Candida] intermedia]